MDPAIETEKRASLRDYLAAERTYLAWIRTGLALMGFGFVVARFGVFLQELHAARTYGLSWWFGTALIAIGVIVNVSAGWRHSHLVRELDRGETSPPYSSTQTLAIALFLTLVGLAMAIYLISIQSPSRPQPANNKEALMTSSKDNGIINKPSTHSVDYTVEKLKGILQAKELHCSRWLTIAERPRR